MHTLCITPPPTSNCLSNLLFRIVLTFYVVLNYCDSLQTLNFYLLSKSIIIFQQMLAKSKQELKVFLMYHPT